MHVKEKKIRKYIEAKALRKLRHRNRLNMIR